MRIYVSTRGDKLGMSQAKRAAELLEAHGHEITYRWWETIEAQHAGGATNDADLTPEQREMLAEANFDGVRTAQVLVYIEPHEKSEGAAWELGVAWGLRYMLRREDITALPVIVVGARRGFMFSELSDFRVPEIALVPKLLDTMKLRAARHR